MRPHKVGMICLATNQGLGYLARDFYNSGLIDYVYIHEHSSRPSHREWYPATAIVPTREVLLEKSDVIFAIETFFDWKIIPQAREKGKKTVLMPMYECSNYPLPYVPDLVLSPSALDLDYYPDSTLVTVPVNLDNLKPRIRSKAEVFVHNGGNGGLGGRNGTKELVEAMRWVKSPIKLILRSQIPIKIPNDPRIDLRVGTFDDIWSEGDVFVFPERFNGLSLPIAESFSSGLPVMCGARYPMTSWLPNEIMIPIKGYKKERLAVEFDMAIYDPVEIAQTIDKWYGQDISELSQKGIEWGKQNSWPNLKKTYEQLFSFSYPQSDK